MNGTGERRIREPATMATDLALALAGAWFAWSIAAAHGRVSAWCAAFVFASVAAACGAVVHGFADYLSRRTHRLVWTSALLTSCAASVLFALAGVTAAGLAPRTAGLLGAVAIIAFAAAVIRSPVFLIAAIAAALSLVILFGCALLLFPTSPGAARFLFAATGLTASGVVIQRTGFTLHRHMNNNDLFHVLQLAAFWCVFRAAVLLP